MRAELTLALEVPVGLADRLDGGVGRLSEGHAGVGLLALVIDVVSGVVLRLAFALSVDVEERDVWGTAAGAGRDALDGHDCGVGSDSEGSNGGESSRALHDEIVYMS